MVRDWCHVHRTKRYSQNYENYTNKIHFMKYETQEKLKIGSCVQNEIDVETLSLPFFKKKYLKDLVNMCTAYMWRY